MPKSKSDDIDEIPVKLLEKILIGVASASLSVSAWLIKDRIESMTETIRNLTDAQSELLQRVQELRIEQSELKNRLDEVTTSTIRRDRRG